MVVTRVVVWGIVSMSGEVVTVVVMGVGATLVSVVMEVSVPV
jgi:hypothetical protein